MFSIHERYSQAIRSSNLTCDVNTTFSDLDVIGAMALADRRLSHAEFRPRVGSGAVSRLLGGDESSRHEVVRILAERAVIRSSENKRQISEVQAKDLAMACLAWLLHGSCKVCGGHGVMPIKDSPALSKNVCRSCLGSRKISFIKHFTDAQLEMAQWLVQEVARDLGLCGAEALRAIAPRKAA